MKNLLPLGANKFFKSSPNFGSNTGKNFLIGFLGMRTRNRKNNNSFLNAPLETACLSVVAVNSFSYSCIGLVVLREREFNIQIVESNIFQQSEIWKTHQLMYMTASSAL